MVKKRLMDALRSGAWGGVMVEWRYHIRPVCALALQNRDRVPRDVKRPGSFGVYFRFHDP
tara:strand:+ start:623 stop:802 length:180 start_codon:yes stop_codon:yes gene_type:complete